MTPTEIRKARASLGLSQDQLAAVMDLGKRGGQTVSEWERGVRQPRGPTARLLRAYLIDGYRPDDWPT